jgi:F0F1-type ATP synthase assembly protein I
MDDLYFREFVCCTRVSPTRSHLMNGPDPKYDGWRQVALLTSIPMILLFGPLVGYFIGDFLDQLFGTSPWLMIIFTAMGSLSGVKQTITLIKRATDQGSHGS